MGITTAAADLDERLAAMRRRVDGEVLVPGDERFAVFADGCDAAVIVVAADVGDVVAAMSFAAALRLGVAERNDGHLTDVLLVTSALDQVEIDAEARVAWVGAGARLSAVAAAAAEHELAVKSSSASGAVGSSLPDIDDVRSLEVVTTAGELVRTCCNEHPDLFRALCQGTPGLAVVTEIELGLSLAPQARA
jgi:FAD/FMN-containing dehydrogenase